MRPVWLRDFSVSLDFKRGSRFKNGNTKAMQLHEVTGYYSLSFCHLIKEI